MRGLYPSSLFPTSLCGVLVPHIFVWGSCSSVMHSCDSRPLPSTRRLLSRTTLSHTTLSHTHRHTHTQLRHTQLFHTTLSHNIVTHNSVTHSSLTSNFVTQLFHIQLCHTHTHLVTHTTLSRATHIHHTTLGDIDATSAWQAWHLRRWAGSGGVLGWFGRQMSHAQLCHTGPSHTQLTPTTL